MSQRRAKLVMCASLHVGASFIRPACLGMSTNQQLRQVVAAYIRCLGWRTPILHPMPYAVGHMERQGSSI